MVNDMDVEAYLQRINYRGVREVTAGTLRDLHLAHLQAVPFENWSIHIGEPIVLDDEVLFAKIVGRRRGGFCYELNGLFAALLRALGYEVAMLNAAVWGEKGFGPEFDHMALLVSLEQPWLVDVGFGDSFREPLPLVAGQEQVQLGQVYRLVPEGEHYVLQRRPEDSSPDAWQPQYRFTLQPHTYADYAAMCHYQQTSPDSHFTQRRVCTRITPDGRITLSGQRLIISRHGERQEQELADEAAVLAALREYFGIELG